MRLATRLAGALAAACCLAVLAPLVAKGKSGSVWPGHFILLVDSSVAEGEVLARLSSVGFSKVITESRQPVQITNFHTLETLSLADCDKRLVEGDPRADTYIDGLRSWFHAKSSGGDYRVYYVASGPGLGGTRLDKAFKGLGAGYLLPEMGLAPRSSLLGFSIFLLALVALAFSAFYGSGLRGLLFSLASSLPFLPLATRGGEASCLATLSLALFAVALPALVRAFEEFGLSRSPARAWEEVRRAGLTAILFSLTFVGFLALEPALLPEALLALGAAGLALGTAVSFEAERTSRMTSRRRFVPVRIIPGAARPRGEAGEGRLLHHALPALAVISALVFLSVEASLSPKGKTATASASGLLLPLPGPAEGPARLEPEAAARLSALKPPGSPVDLADWLVHRWYQESLFYESLDARGSQAFSTVVVPNPVEEGRNVTKTFDKAWAQAAWRGLPQGGVESLLLSLGAYARPSMRALSGGDARPLASPRSLLYIILVAPPVLGALPLDKRGIRRVRERKKTR